MSRANFTLIFDGPAVANGQIDVQDLAPALLAIGDLIQSANDTVNEGKSKASVKVRSTAKGSFEVDLTIWQDLLHSFFSYAEFHRDGFAAENDLADLILKVGSVCAAPTGGLLFLIKWLRGRRADQVVEKNGEVVISIKGDEFIANAKVIKLAEDMNVRQQERKLVSVLEREGIESICSKRSGGETLKIERGDVRYFDIPDQGDEKISDEVRVMMLQIISLSFKEDNKWRLTDGAEPFSATIEDINFLKKIANNEVSFAKNDYLECEVRERQVQSARGLKKERTIIRVINHRPAARQLRLI